MGNKKGYKQTEEHKQKERENAFRQFKDGMPLKTRKKISRSHKGKYLGEKNPNWKNGIKYIDGYKYIYFPTHISVKRRKGGNKKYIPEHVLVIEKHLGRYLKKGEVVHHINGKKDDNRLKNLMIFKNNSAHMKMHNQSGINWKNKNEVKEYKKKYKEDNKKYLKKYQKYWYLKNKHKIKKNG